MSWPALPWAIAVENPTGIQPNSGDRLPAQIASGQTAPSTQPLQAAESTSQSETDCPPRAYSVWAWLTGHLPQRASTATAYALKAQEHAMHQPTLGG